MCWKRKCSYAPYSHVAGDPWIALFWLLKSEVITQNGLGRMIMRKADALDMDTIEVLTILQGTLNKWQQDQLPKPK